MSLADQTLQFFPISARVSVLRARGLRTKGKDGTNDAYTTLQAGRETFRTPVSEKLAEPVWGGSDAVFIFTLPAERQQDGVPLQVRVFHRVPLGADKLLGLAVINVHELRQNSTRENPQWFKLLNKTGKADKERGEVLLDIQFLKSSMSVSMIDLSEKSQSRLGKFKDKLRGNKKDGISDSASAILPSASQVLTDSEGEMGGETEGETTKKKKKNKLKSLFVPKSNMKRNSLSQSLSSLKSLPDKNSSISSSTSSGLNVESSEEKKKKKFPFLTHKRNGSTDSRTSNNSDFTFSSTNQNSSPEIEICINGSHVYREQTQSEKMQDMDEEEEEEEADVGENEDEEEKWRREEELQERLEEEKNREAEEARKRKEKEEQRRKKEEEEEEEEERLRRERQKEENRKRIEEEEKESARMEKEIEEQRRRMEEEEKERIRVEKEEEKQRVRMAREKEQQMRRMVEEKERIKMEREKEERIRLEEVEKERIIMEREQEKQKRRLEEEEIERIRMEEERIRVEEKEKERFRMEREKEEQRKLEEKERERIRIERENAEKRRVEEEEKEKQREKEEQKRKLEEEEKMRIKRENEEQRRRLEEERKRREEKEAEELLIKMSEEKKQIEMERRLADEKKAREEEERRIALEKEKRRKEEERIREENERKSAEMEKKEEALKRRNMEMGEKKKKEKQMKEEEERLKKEDNTFEESVSSQATDFTRSVRISNVKPRVSVSATVSQPSSVNTNPFLDDELYAASFEERTAKKGPAPLPPQFVGPDVCTTAASKELSHSKEVSKRQAPQPPGLLKMSREVADQESTAQPSGDQGARKERHQKSTVLSVSQDDAQVDTNPFTCDAQMPVKHKRPAPKPDCGKSVSEDKTRSNGKILTEGTVHNKEKASASDSKNNSPNWKLIREPNNITVEDVKSDLTADQTRREEHLDTPSDVNQDLFSELVVSRTDGLLSMESSHKKTQAPLPPNKPERPEDPSTLHQHLSLPNKTNLKHTQVNHTNQKDQDNASLSFSAFSPLADKSQVVKRFDSETGETSSKSGSGTWAKVVSSDVGEQVAPTPVIRQQAVKPLSAAEKQPETSESRGTESTQPKTKAVEAVMKGPYSQLTQTELISLALRQQEQISQRDLRIQELEQYIDGLLVRVIEEKPSILMSLNTKNKSI